MDTLNQALTLGLSSSVGVPSVLQDSVLRANPTPPAFLPRAKEDKGTKGPHYHPGQLLKPHLL